jgi:hypothetical protein
MNNSPGKFTPGFINTMDTYLKSKKLPYEFHHDKARKNWAEL